VPHLLNEYFLQKSAPRLRQKIIFSFAIEAVFSKKANFPQKCKWEKMKAQTKPFVLIALNM
jgi:hypothetical protein